MNWTTIEESLQPIALSAGYEDADLRAGLDAWQRKHRCAHPPGEFDKAGRFYAAERTSATNSCRPPSAKWPYSELTAARSAPHVAEVHDRPALNIKRIVRAIELIDEPNDTAEKPLREDLAKILKTAAILNVVLED